MSMIGCKKILTALAAFVFSLSSFSIASCDSHPSNVTTYNQPSIEILNGNEVQIEINNTLQLLISTNNLEERVQYESFAPNIASVNSSGLVSAISEGETYIKVYSREIYDTIKITVIQPTIPVQPSITILTESPLFLNIDEFKLIEYETNNYCGEIYVSNSDSNVVNVMAQFKNTIAISGLSYGTSVLTLTLEDGTNDSIEVTVQPDGVQKLNISLSRYSFKVGETSKINVSITPSSYYNSVTYEIIEGNNLIEIVGNTITAIKSGKAKIRAVCDGFISNTVEISVFDFTITMSSFSMKVGEHRRLGILNYNGTNQGNLQWSIADSSVISLQYSLMGDIYVSGLKTGNTSLYLFDSDDLISNTVEIMILENNPYENISKEEFYSNYSVSNSYEDAMYRSEYNLMSGTIEVPNQAPTISSYQPSIDGKLIHNSSTSYSNKGNTYSVVNSFGEKTFDVYYGAAYTSLEEVAAYVYAWGDVPINYINEKSANPQDYVWGEYLRLNNSYFSGDISSFPFEPELPNISGCGGNLVYYEIDIGTLGTDCDPRYEAALYNDGSKITRGAARLVYSRFYADTGEIVRPEDRFVFYTYNHYNDFQEYLNYENGWGNIFGNITGGGTISSSNPETCNPTNYIESIRQSLTSV